MFDFGAFPPEFNSGRMYTGAGAGPLLAAASTWDAVAAELATAASSYNSVITELTSSPWLGPASRSMMAAVAPYVGWLSAASGQAEETATQARAAAAAYEAAFAMTVPPPVIAANRVLLATLVATNFFGQNTPAIMATEAQYLEMWAQDAAAMYGYAASSAVATTLTPFLDPPTTASPNATTTQSAAVAQATAQPASNSAQAVSSSSVPQLLANAALPQAAPAATDPLPWPLSLIYDTINNLLTKGLPTPTDNFLGLVPANYMTVLRSLSGLPYFTNGMASFGLSIGQQLYNGPLGTTAGSAGAFIPSPQFAALGAGGWSSLHPTAGLASATHIGGTGPGLSVPASWANSTGAAGSAANTKLMTTSLLGTPEGNLNGAGANAALRGAPMVGAGRGAQRAGNLGVRYGVRYSVLTRPPSAG